MQDTRALYNLVHKEQTAKPRTFFFPCLTTSIFPLICCSCYQNESAKAKKNNSGPSFGLHYSLPPCLPSLSPSAGSCIQWPIPIFPLLPGRPGITKQFPAFVADVFPLCTHIKSSSGVNEKAKEFNTGFIELPK